MKECSKGKFEFASSLVRGKPMKAWSETIRDLEEKKVNEELPKDRKV